MFSNSSSVRSRSTADHPPTTISFADDRWLHLWISFCLLVFTGGALVFSDLSLALCGLRFQFDDDIAVVGRHVHRLPQIRGQIVECEVVGIGFAILPFFVYVGRIARCPRGFAAALTFSEKEFPLTLADQV